MEYGLSSQNVATDGHKTGLKLRDYRRGIDTRNSSVYAFILQIYEQISQWSCNMVTEGTEGTLIVCA